MKIKSNSGFTIVEMIVVLLIITLLTSAGAQYSKQLRAAKTGKLIGTQLKEGLGGLSAYQSANFDTLAVSGAVAGFAAPLTPTEAELKAAGYLQGNFNGASLTPTGYRWTIERLPVGCVAPACDLRATVNTISAILDEDSKINYGLLQAATDEIGNDASYSEDTAPATISGKNGAWTQANPQGAVTGVLLAHAGFGATGLSQFVRQGDTRAINLNGGLAVNGGGGLTAANGNITTLASNNGTIATLNSTTGNITTGNIPTVNSGNITNTGNITSPNATLTALNSTTGTITTVNSATINNTGTINTANAIASGKVTTGSAQINTVAVEGTACPVNGEVKRDATGLLLSCQSSIWGKASGSNGNVLTSSNYPTFLGSKAGSGSMACSGGGTFSATISVSSDAQSLTFNPIGSNSSNCYAGYWCNGYGCMTPAGTFNRLSQANGGVTYVKYRSLGLGATAPQTTVYITLGLQGWTGSYSGYPNPVSMNGTYN